LTPVNDLSITSIAECKEVAAVFVMFEIIEHLSPNLKLCNVSSPLTSSDLQYNDDV
jgi:hypothetical protein